MGRRAPIYKRINHFPSRSVVVRQASKNDLSSMGTLD